ncbi:MAG: DNA-3-methyladenine glycosylase 2 family protein [Rhodospirillales bacterium]|nr:DNA-3-methyladenine glycosylase 2 family protein [Alphaproteobacteria bacterium]MCB9987025.1 DNA-3-methyladenine glycosylase 2 family protein [Rhodospirillales bacterium]USO08205.1 MAG: DNA-3-methyladenine glycosylase 2 family protein [Rhodospirillales bacterium]
MLLNKHKSIRPSLEHLVQNDRHFKKIFTLSDIDSIAHRHRPCSYAAFVRTIVGQQLSTKAAATIWGRVAALADPFVPETVLALDDAALRGAGLSGQKIGYLRGLSAAVAAGDFSFSRLRHMDDAEVIAAITALKGFGRWSAEMVLIFALARLDVFSGGDLGLREGMRRVLKLDARPSEKAAVKLAERWAGHRTAASLLLWHTQTLRD